MILCISCIEFSLVHFCSSNRYNLKHINYLTGDFVENCLKQTDGSSRSALYERRNTGSMQMTQVNGLI